MWASPYLEAQAAYLRYLGSLSDSHVRERGGSFAVRTLVRSNAENGVVSDGVAPVPAAVIDELVAWFAQHERPACWLCADGPSRVETARRLEGAGCRADLEAREMHAALRHLDLRDQSPPDGVEIRLVSNGSDIDGWLDIAGHCDWYDGPAQRDVWRALYVSVGFAGTPPIRLYLATRGDRPVGIASAFYVGRTVFMTAVAVADDERRRGIGRALALTRLREATQHGSTIATLSPSPDGFELYRRLGFTVQPIPAGRWFHLPAR
jgi:ribosomal protein S18 acetylase RimI-like enzyme